MTIPDGGAPGEAGAKAGEPGETDLRNLLDSLSPKLMAGDYVFCSIPASTYGDYAQTAPIASFQEKEGLTLVMRKESADLHGLAYGPTYRCITLDVHSSLDAVGLTATVSARLLEKQISANIIAAYFHDHVFVPSNRAGEALAVLSAFHPAGVERT